MDSIPVKRPLILDGGTATGLTQYGYDYEQSLEKWILANPDKFSELQKGFIEAGSDVIYTPTLTANPFMLKKFELSDDCEEINGKLAELTRKNAGGRVTIAGDIGMTQTAVIPFSEVSFSELISQYRRQVKALNPYVDMFVIETITSMSDMRAAILACKKTGKPIMVTVPVNEEGVTYGDEIPAEAMLLTAQALGVNAFGINCTQAENALEALKKLKPLAHIPLIAKPCNSIWDSQNMTERSPEEADSFNKAFLDLGIEIIGGCCGTTAEHIAHIKKLTEEYKPNVSEIEKEDVSLVFVSGKQCFFLQPDMIETTETLTCSVNMDEDILEECSGSNDVLTVEINSPDDAIDFTKSSPMVTLPVMFRSDNEIAIKMALMLFQGRAMIDSQSLIEEEKMKEIAEKYGALIY